MTLRFGLPQILAATALVATLDVATFARDDDPRDFRRYDSRNGSNNESKRNNSQNSWRNNGNDRDDDDDDDRNKVTICHKAERVDDDDDGHRGFIAKTIEISRSALNAHLNHGDTLGPCPRSASTSARPNRDKDRDDD
jgi:hypothetical protein